MQGQHSQGYRHEHRRHPRRRRVSRRSFAFARRFGAWSRRGAIAEDENFELIDAGKSCRCRPRKPARGDEGRAHGGPLAARKPRDLRLGVETSLYLDERTFVEPDLCLYPKQILPEDVRGRDVLLAVIEVVAFS